ncbi:hypothetical protein CSC18_0354 [Klebsiella aerogenes]|nr:hypothetical protein CSC18_0354 [Klebsiella aerogenes]
MPADSLPPSGKPKSIEEWICLVGLISEAPSGKNPEIKIPGFFIISGTAL